MKRRKRRPPTDYLIAGALALLLIWLLVLLFGIVGKEERARHAAGDAKAELTSLILREETLRENLEELQTERGQEASLRETYGVAKPGEEVIIVIEPGEGDRLGELPWWRKFLGFFGL